MRRIDYFYYITLFICGIPGCIWRSFAGGLITGAAWGILIVVLIGKTGAIASAKRIDKRMKDILTEQE